MMILLNFLSGLTRLLEWSSVIVPEIFLMKKINANFPLNTERKLKVHKRSQTSHERPLYVLVGSCVHWDNNNMIILPFYYQDHP